MKKNVEDFSVIYNIMSALSDEAQTDQALEKGLEELSKHLHAEDITLWLYMTATATVSIPGR